MVPSLFSSTPIDREVVKPTWRKVGTAVGATDSGACYVRIEMWCPYSEILLGEARRGILQMLPSVGWRVYVDFALEALAGGS